MCVGLWPVCAWFKNPVKVSCIVNVGTTIASSTQAQSIPLNAQHIILLLRYSNKAVIKLFVHGPHSYDWLKQVLQLQYGSCS